MQHALAPALGQAGDVRQLIGNAKGEHQLPRRHRSAAGKRYLEATLGCTRRHCFCRYDRDGWIGFDLRLRARDHRERRGAILTEEAVCCIGKAVTASFPSTLSRSRCTSRSRGRSGATIETKSSTPVRVVAPAACTAALPLAGQI